MKSLNLSSIQGRILVGSALLILGLLIGWVGRGVITADDDVPHIAAYNDWRVSCPARSDKDADCTIVQDVLDAKTGAEVLHLRLLNNPEGKNRKLIITAPFGVLIPPGIGLKLGNDQVKTFAYETCIDAGCFVDIKLDNELMRALRRGGRSEIRLAGPDEKVVSINFSLSGFKDAMRAFEEAEAERKSWFRRLWL